MFKKAFVAFSLLILLSIFLSGFSSSIHAQTDISNVRINADTPTEEDPCPAIISQFLQNAGSNQPQTPPAQATTSAILIDGGANFSTNPTIECIDESLPYVDITFNNLTPGQGSLLLCTGSQKCMDEDNEQKGRLIGLPKSADGSGSITIRVCGDGDKKVKVQGALNAGSTSDRGNCNDIGKNWFWGGHAYIMSIGYASDGVFEPVRGGGFYVSRLYPNITISPNKNLTTSTVNGFSVKLEGNPRPGGNRRNNYQVHLSGPTGTREGCINIGQTASFPGIKTAGTYTIQVKEQVDELNKDAGSIIGTFIPFVGDSGGETIDKLRNPCQGGFIYYQVVCMITTPDGNGSCTDPNEGRDPKGEEYKAFLKELNKLNSILGTGLSFPCGDGAPGGAKTLGTCLTLDTAIGSINVSTQGFVRDIFRFVIGIAGLGGIIVLIYCGYLIMMSHGDKEKVQAARETITSAIVGLLFIIFSIVILEIIGVDILQIPGLDR